MDKLPNEVLDFVFNGLHLFQKQECMLVCRRWSNIIRSKSLFSTVHLNSADMFDRLTKILDDSLSYRLQIQSLIIHGNLSLTFSAKTFLYYFPNLRFFYGKSVQSLLKRIFTTKEYPSVDLESWRNQIEKMEISSSLSGNTMLSLGVFSYLKSLDMNNSFLLQSLSSIAFSAPNINSLVVRSATISLNDLESLQTDLKALQHLTLEDVNLSHEDGLNDVSTTNSLITLFISFRYTCSSTIVKWLQYITRNCHLLLNFRFIFPWNTRPLPQHNLNITRNGLVPLLQNLGHQLNYIEINILDEVSTILNNLSILNNDKQIVRINTLFSDSRTSFKNPQLWNLGKFINQLTITKDTLTWRSLSYLRFMETLKRLRVGYLYKPHLRERPVCSNGLFNAIPDSLESLEIFHFDIELHGKIARRYLLKELAIHSNSIPQNVYRFISDSFPRLNRLTIDQQHATTNNITLWGVDLDYLEISLNQKYFISLITLDDPILRYYRFGPYKPYNLYSNDVQSVESYKPIHQITSKNILDPKQVINFNCKRVKTFVVNKQLAF